MKRNPTRSGSELYRLKNGALLGVLQGVADYFGLPVLWLRLGAILGLFFSGFFPMIALYVMMALVMKKEPESRYGRQSLSGEAPKKFYRARDGVIFGVVKGIAHYFDFSLSWLRFFSFIIVGSTGFIPGMAAYGLAAILMSKEPVVPLGNMAEQEFYDSYAHSRQGAIHRVKRRYNRLEERLRRMESIVTDREFDWKRKFQSSAG